ncbi:MAG: hypothetical protein ACI4B5_03065 [Bacteroidaceae bacterium]
MKRALSCFLFAYAVSLMAQGPWKLKLNCSTEKINLKIDLYEESISVPSMEDFGPMNGYMDGNIYGVWTITSFDIKDDKNAILNLSNDLGSETQATQLTQLNDTTWSLKLMGRPVIKKVVGKKLVKIPTELIMKQVK